jgi:hypothetical protein
MDPFTIAALASTGGSVLANMFGQGQQDRAMARALGAERGRQAGFDAETDALNKGARQRYAGFAGQQGAETGELARYFAELTPAAAAPGVVPQTQSAVTAGAVDRANAGVRAYGDQQNGALSELRSFGDILADRSRLTARDAGSVAQIGGFKQGSAGVAGMEMQAAQNRGGGARTLADILQLAGQIGTRAALSGGSVPGGWTTTIEAVR